MIDLLLSKPVWNPDENADFAELRIALFNELETTIWAIMTSEGRSEARLWLCDAISNLQSIAPQDQHDLFMSLLKSKPLNRNLAVQVLQLIFERRPHKIGLILAKKRLKLEKFFEGHPRRILQWFSTFSTEGDSAHRKGAKALSQFAFVNRDICWEELEWRGKHGQSPAVVATKPHYFLDLDVQRTVENFLENVPEFWSSKEFAESLKDGEILSVDKFFFVDFFVNLMYKDNLKEVWEVISEFLMDESFSYLCHHLLIILDDRDLCVLLQMLHNFLSRRKEVVNFDDASYWLDIVIHKCGDQVSMDQLFLLNALFNKGRQLLRLVKGNDEEEKVKVNDLVLKIWTNTVDAKSLAPITRDCFKSKTLEVMRWLGVLSWCLLYRLSEECHSAESWKDVFIGNKIGYRRSDAYGLLEHNGSSEEGQLERGHRGAKHKKRQKSRKKRKRNRNSDYDNLPDDELLDLDDSDDKFSIQLSSRSWLLSTDGYSTSWSLVDLPEHLSKYFLREWMKQTFN